MSAFTIFNIATAYLITIIGFWQALLISEWQTMTSLHSKILESPNKHNAMTSFGIRRIISRVEVAVL